MRRGIAIAAGLLLTFSCAFAQKTFKSSDLSIKKGPSERIAAKNRDNCFFVVCKTAPEHLSVYEVIGRDTVKLAEYPACMGKNKGHKQKSGDMKTPESGKVPFKISQIQDASSWRHDFGDGRGNILSYGHWFMRLDTRGFKGIGIHGSTNNESSVPGRASEGCIRLLDKDIIHLHDNYARVGTPVYILHEGETD